ncbi:MAG: PfkB family carbohydrate kinase [Pirellulales bacterium]|nr:PfkB family carbohydrate kinase [Pirellulales bacterium]
MILAAGLTPAWQQILQFRQLTPGEVNRATAAQWCGSGKVLNVGRALHNLIQESPPNQPLRCLTLSPLGGLARQAIAREFAKDGIPLQVVESSVPTRVCTTLLEQSGQRTTELVENAAALPAIELSEYLRQFQELLPICETVILSGSLPNGTPSDYYAQLLTGCRCRVILDARGAELRHTLAMRPWLVKPNRQELAATAGIPCDSSEHTWQAMHQVQVAGAQWVVISAGPEAIFVAGPGEKWIIHPPKLARVVNPIACGDTLAAGIAWGMELTGQPIIAIRWGVAAAAANAETLLPARWERGRVAELFGLTGVEQVT